MRNSNTERNNRKKNSESLEILLFDLVSKNAEQQITGDHLRTGKSIKEGVDFLHDQRTLAKYKTPPLILKPQGMTSARIQANAFILLTKPYPRNFQEKLQSKTRTQAVNRELGLVH